MLSHKLLETLREWWRRERPSLGYFLATFPGATLAPMRWSMLARRLTVYAALPNPLLHTASGGLRHTTPPFRVPLF
jgi:hypothetical protein